MADDPNRDILPVKEGSCVDTISAIGSYPFLYLFRIIPVKFTTVPTVQCSSDLQPHFLCHREHKFFPASCSRLEIDKLYYYTNLLFTFAYSDMQSVNNVLNIERS